MKTSVVETYKLSKTFDAPLDFVFKWCTDFREDDGKMIGSKTKRKFLERNKERLTWIVNYKENGKLKEGIRTVWLNPPDAWHLDTCGDGYERGEYKLTSLGKGKTRLDMVFDVTYDNPREVEPKKQWEEDGHRHWDIYAKHLEDEYKASMTK